MRFSLACGVLVASGLLAAAAVRAQVPPGSISGAPREVLIVGRDPDLSQNRYEPLSAEQLERLRQAQSLRATGRRTAARRVLDALRAERPHHPQVLTELARLMMDASDFAGVARLARSERWTQKDSLLLGRELATAYERLEDLRNAAKVVVEMWVVAPDQADWARMTLSRLYPADPNGTVQALRGAFRERPTRLDLARTLALLEWRQGDAGHMLDVLRTIDRLGMRPPLRWMFADELLRNAAANDSSGALQALIDLSGDKDVDVTYRTPAARRAWAILGMRGEQTAGAERISVALRDLPPDRWDPDFLVELVRALRESGRTEDARRLIAPFEDRATLVPELAIERALADLRDGPPQRAYAALEATARVSAEGRYRLAEALFFGGMVDSALATYRRVAEDPHGAYTGAAFERIYLIEDAKPRDVLPVFGRIEYASWRGDTRRALALADSLYRTLPTGELWTQTALKVAEFREALGDPKGALEPLLAVADSMPEARLASLARQRAGDIYLTRLGDEAHALEQYEECVARYPRAWNAPEVRRKLQTLRRERRL